MRVLIVEDETAVADSIKDCLDRAGFVCEVCNDGENAWFLGGTEEYSAVILDLGLPKLDGLTVLKRWRAEGHTMPVIILTARGQWTERVEGIDAGADDYLAKPFQMEELIARLHAVLRRSAGLAGNVQNIGSMVIDPRKRSVTVNGVPVPLTLLEFRLLTCFALHSNETVTATKLLNHVYGHDNDKDINALEALVGRLRRKIGPDVIGTRRGQGYYMKIAE
jgi:DNA-binding response OmpR family regulator